MQNVDLYLAVSALGIAVWNSLVTQRRERKARDAVNDLRAALTAIHMEMRRAAERPHERERRHKWVEEISIRRARGDFE